MQKSMIFRFMGFPACSEHSTVVNDLRAGIRNARPGSVILCQKPTIFYSGARGEGLECSERAENLINRKIGTFYIETISQNFSQLRQKIFFRARSKTF